MMGIVGNLHSQEKSDLQNFTGLKQSGLLPEDITAPWIEKYQAALKDSEGQGLKRQARKNREEFWAQQHYGIQNKLKNGRFSFGDPIAKYLEDITDKLLEEQPELEEQIRVYHYKAPSVNAFAVANGIIGVHTGLVAHSKSEAELAFVIAHESAHVTEKHSYDSYRQEKELDNTGWFEESINPIAQFDQRVMRSKEHELEADSIGLQVLGKTIYHPEEVRKALTTLHHSYIPYGRIAVGLDFLATDRKSIPSFFYRSEITPISKEEDYFDETHTHPNVFKRRKALEKNLQQVEAKGKQRFSLGKERFEKIRNLARFEVVRQKLLYADYAEALYDIYVLEEDFPGNRFLELSKVRALYGLASLKSVNKLSHIMPSTYEVEGPSQQVFHLLKQLRCVQMNTLALHHVFRAKKKYPQAKFLDTYADNLTKYLKAYCGANIEDFRVANDTMPSFDKDKEDFGGRRALFRAKQEHYSNFHKYFIQDQVKSGWLAKKLKSYQSFKDSLEREKSLSYDYKEERREKRLEKLDEEGLGIDIDRVTLLDPRLIIMHQEDLDPKNLRDYWEDEQELKEVILNMEKDLGLAITPFYTSAMGSQDTDMYDQYASLKEAAYQARFLQKLDLSVIFTRLKDVQQLPSRYVCQVLGKIDGEHDDYYYFRLLDTHKGRFIYNTYSNQGKKLSLREMEKETEKHLSRVSK
ncbi:MAG: M48 family metalloprotease [Schleiferiaceae bacterium]|nr:M48 family metalloprotease [Schleiferiaceae bacterium]